MWMEARNTIACVFWLLLPSDMTLPHLTSEMLTSLPSGTVALGTQSNRTKFESSTAPPSRLAAHTATWNSWSMSESPANSTFLPLHAWNSVSHRALPRLSAPPRRCCRGSPLAGVALMCRSESDSSFFLHSLRLRSVARAASASC